MKYIALTGQIASGKTAVAKELATRGYLLISYTDLLKRILADALTAVGVPTALDDILANKEHYRALLQEFGTVIGFDSGDLFIEEALAEWRARGCPPAVFDNVRTNQQAEGVQEAGFTIVETRADHYTRFARLVEAGRDPQTLMTTGKHVVEQGISDEHVEMLVDTSHMTAAQVADFLETLPVEELIHE